MPPKGSHEFDHQIILTYIERRWISPANSELDQEDQARIHLIQELQSVFGVNDEAVPIILHLIDQLHFFQNKVRSRNTP
jgi:chaperone modulatory protein CbpM